MAAKIDTVSAALLIEDDGLYPRTDVDSTNVTRLVEALEAGRSLPPIVVWRKTMKIVDGFHRKRAYRKWGGRDDVEVPVEYRDYPNDGAAFKDACELNAGHGRPLSNFDKLRCLTRAKELKLSVDDLAKVLRYTANRAKELIASRTATGAASLPFASPQEGGRNAVPLKGGMRHLAGEKLTKEQAEANAKGSGMSPTFHAQQLIMHIEAGTLDLDNRNLVHKLERLRELIGERVLAAA